MSVKRYDLVGDMDGNCNLNEARMDHSEDGIFVKHEDYAALQQQLEKMAAENAGLKSFGDKLGEMHNDLNGEGTGIQGRAEVACQQVALEAAMEEFDAIKTPATSAFLAEVRAQAKADGVQEYADSFRHSASKIRECYGDNIRVRALLHEANNADDFAAQLRKGVQS